MRSVQSQRIAHAASIVLGVWLFASDAHGSESEQLAVERLFTETGPRAGVVSESATGRVLALRALAWPLAAGRERPGEAVAEWVTAQAEAFGLRPGIDQVRARDVETLASGRRRVTIDQLWQGLPVIGGESRAVVDRDGVLQSFAAGFRPGLTLDSEPRISSDMAIAAVATALSADLAREPASARLVIRAEESSERLAYEVTIEDATGRPVRSWVDARTGAIVVLDDGIAHATGFAYTIDPLGPLVQVTLPGLGPGTGLSSRFLRVEDSVGAPAAQNSAGDFELGPGSGSFDQVNAYYHAGHFLSEFLGRHLGASDLPDSVLLRVHFRTDPFVAFTSGRFVYLGQPIAGFVHEVSSATDLVIHETTHAVLYGHDIQPTSLRREAGALHEGYADYFAAAVTGDPAIGEWLYIPFPNGATRVDQPLPAWHASNYDRIGFGGGEAASPWGNGMILSSALWDLRTAIGPSADSLVIESLDYMPSAPQWGHFANALLQADIDHHDARHQTAILIALLRRGIRGAAESRIIGPTTLVGGQVGRFTAGTCCGGAPGNYEWHARGWCRGGPCSDWRLLGTGPELESAFEEDTELRLRVLSLWGDTLDSAPMFVASRLPELAIEGPRLQPRDVRGVWSVRVSAVGPASIRWSRRYLAGSSFAEEVPGGEAVSFEPRTTFDLTATVRDGLNRTVSRTVRVETFDPRTIPDGNGRFQVVLRFEPGMRAANIRFEVPRPAPVDARVYDVRGRERAVVWTSPATVGAHILRWDAGDLESGVYFLRARAGGETQVQRLFIVR